MRHQAKLDRLQKALDLVREWYAEDYDERGQDQTNDFETITNDTHTMEYCQQLREILED